jgi:hypothetical protein
MVKKRSITSLVRSPSQTALIGGGIRLANALAPKALAHLSLGHRPREKSISKDKRCKRGSITAFASMAFTALAKFHISRA